MSLLAKKTCTSVTLDLVRYANLAKFRAKQVKLNFSKVYLVKIVGSVSQTNRTLLKFSGRQPHWRNGRKEESLSIKRRSSRRFYDDRTLSAKEIMAAPRFAL